MISTIFAIHFLKAILTQLITHNYRLFIVCSIHMLLLTLSSQGLNIHYPIGKWTFRISFAFSSLPSVHSFEADSGEHRSAVDKSLAAPSLESMLSFPHRLLYLLLQKLWQFLRGWLVWAAHKWQHYPGTKNNPVQTSVWPLGTLWRSGFPGLLTKDLHFLLMYS